MLLADVDDELLKLSSSTTGDHNDDDYDDDRYDDDDHDNDGDDDDDDLCMYECMYVYVCMSIKAALVSMI